MIGSELANRYKVEAELGRGGMGIVYKGHDTRLNRPVAIKILSSPELSDEDRTHLLVEAQAAAQLNHQNIVTVYDALEAGNQPFIVMEYVEGRTLRSIPQPTIKESIEYVRQICSALAHAHSKGIIHRDLKPENALLTPTGLVKLMDFGLARRMEGARMTRPGTIIGTFAFMAPELFQGGAPSPQSDLYALGLILYEFLTGNSPFETSNLAILISQHIHKAATLPREVASSLPEGLNELIIQMLDKKPKNRPSSARAVETILASIQTDRAITLPILLEQLGVQSLDELVKTRTSERIKREQEWKRKTYPRSAIPALDTGEKEQVLANRARELARGVQYLNDHRILLITGMPGIGKSTLARALLEFMPSESPPPFWYNFERQQSSGNTLGVLLDRISGYLEKVLGNDVRDEILSFRNSPEHQASSYDVDVLIDALNQPTPLWFVFDNFEAILSKGGDHFLDDGLELLFSSLKHNTHNAKIIISGLFIPRLKNGNYLLEFGTRPLTLRGLEKQFAVQYLRAHGLQDFDDGVLETIAQKFNGHPFALNHAAHYVDAIGVQDALNSLQGGMEEFSEHFKTSIQQRLRADEFSVLQDLTVLQKDISLDGLCRIAQTKPVTIKHLREEGLLDASDTGKFWLPTIVRDNLKDDDTETAQQAHLRAAQFYREQKRPTAPRQIDDFADVLEWHYHAIHAGDVADAYKAVFNSGLIDQLMKWNEFGLCVELCENTQGKLQDKPDSLSNDEQIRLHQISGDANYYLGKYQKSVEYYQTALQAFPKDDTSIARASLMVYLAEAQALQGELSTAMSICQEALALLSDKRNDAVYAKALQTKGYINRANGDLDLAIDDLETARKIYEREEDSRAIANITGELGIVYYYKNDFSLALENYRRAMNTCEIIKDSRGAMIGHFNIGDVLLQQRRYEEAKLELQAALELGRKKKTTKDMSTIGLSLVEAQIALGLFDEAEDELNRLQNILQNSSLCIQGNAKRLEANLLWHKGQRTEAMETYERALELLKEPDCQYELAHAKLDLAGVLHKSGEIDKAQVALSEAEQIFDGINNHLGKQAVIEIRHDLKLI